MEVGLRKALDPAHKPGAAWLVLAGAIDPSPPLGPLVCLPTRGWAGDLLWPFFLSPLRSFGSPPSFAPTPCPCRMVSRRVGGQHTAQQHSGLNLERLPGVCMWDAPRECQGPLGTDVLGRLASSNWHSWGMAWSFYSRRGELGMMGLFLAPRGFNFTVSTFRIPIHPSIHVFGLGPSACASLDLTLLEVSP